MSAQERASLQHELEAGLHAMGIDEPPPGGVGRLLGYIELLRTWNRAYNLTAIDDPLQMVSRHLLDSLSVVPHLRGERILDVGSGAGLPGIPLAIWFPGREFHLVDSLGKKVRFLFEARMRLGLDNVSLHHARVEELQDAAGFDCILSRAVGSLGELVAISSHLLRDGGSMIAMKGEVNAEELRQVVAPYNVAGCTELVVPGIAQKRRLVHIRRD